MIQCRCMKSKNIIFTQNYIVKLGLGIIPHRYSTFYPWAIFCIPHFTRGHHKQSVSLKPDCTTTEMTARPNCNGTATVHDRTTACLNGPNQGSYNFQNGTAEHTVIGQLME